MSVGGLLHFHATAESPIHRLPAGLKLSSALVLVAGTVVAPLRFPWWFAGVTLVLLLATLASRIPLAFLLKRLLVLSPFVLGAALVNALDPARRGDFAGIALKGVLCLATVTLLANTTPFHETLRVLGRLRVPSLLVTTMALMHRYLFVLADEAQRMRRARASRTLAPGRRFRWRATATVAAQVFLRASGRAERIYDAMCARGWR
jgi:cobalt/nickel transport system permease protein